MPCPTTIPLVSAYRPERPGLKTSGPRLISGWQVVLCRPAIYHNKYPCPSVFP